MPLYTHPQIIGEHEREDGDALIVVAPGHRATDVAGHHGDETRSEQPCPGRPHFFGEEVGGYRCQATGRERQAATYTSFLFLFLFTVKEAA